MTRGWGGGGEKGRGGGEMWECEEGSLHQDSFPIRDEIG